MSVNKIPDFHEYSNLIHKYSNNDILNALKKHFSSICCNTDVVINNILKAIEINDEIKFNELLSTYHHCYIIITDELKYWNSIHTLSPDPFWSD